MELTSSPACSNFSLKQAATDFENKFGLDVGRFLRKKFYVDDGLASLHNEDMAICARARLKLHKFVSNSQKVLDNTVSGTDPNKKGVDLRLENLLIERALGVEWCFQSDMFRFPVVLNQRPMTRRGMLATVASVYDPLGFIAPFTLIGKRILQSLCVEGTDWDDDVSVEVANEWHQWIESISDLDKVEI